MCMHSYHGVRVHAVEARILFENRRYEYYVYEPNCVLFLTRGQYPKMSSIVRGGKDIFEQPIVKYRK